jgi:hypothetical protein
MYGKVQFSGTRYGNSNFLVRYLNSITSELGYAQHCKLKTRLQPEGENIAHGVGILEWVWSALKEWDVECHKEDRRCVVVQKR